MVSSAVSKIFMHPYFAGAGLSADIALARLAKPVPFSQTILPICLPNTSDPDPFPVGMKCWATGWGKAFPNGKDDLGVVFIQEYNKSNTRVYVCGR